MTPSIEIRPRRGFGRNDLQELWQHRELVWFLAWRDVRVRYSQTALGALWAVLQPVALMAVFAIFLGRLAKVPAEGASYPMFVLAGLVPWTYASAAVDGAANSVVGNPQLVSKTYFPRLVLPLASTGGPLVDLGISCGLFVIAAAIWDDVFALRALLAPLFLLAAMLASLGVGTCLAALNVRYRDVRFVIRFGMQLWLFMTPVAYPVALVPADWHLVYGLNPLAGPVAAFRWATLGADAPPWTMVGISLVSTIVSLVVGVRYFRRAERTFADVI